MHMSVRCFKIEKQENYKQVNIGPNSQEKITDSHFWIFRVFKEYL